MVVCSQAANQKLQNKMQLNFIDWYAKLQWVVILMLLHLQIDTLAMTYLWVLRALTDPLISTEKLEPKQYIKLIKINT